MVKSKDTYSSDESQKDPHKIWFIIIILVVAISLFFFLSGGLKKGVVGQASGAGDVPRNLDPRNLEVWIDGVKFTLPPAVYQTPNFFEAKDLTVKLDNIADSELEILAGSACSANKLAHNLYYFLAVNTFFNNGGMINSDSPSVIFDLEITKVITNDVFIAATLPDGTIITNCNSDGKIDITDLEWDETTKLVATTLRVNPAAMLMNSDKFNIEYSNIITLLRDNDFLNTNENEYTLIEVNKLVEVLLIAATLKAHNNVDTDGDGVIDSLDNCPLVSNPYITNSDDGGALDTQEDIALDTQEDIATIEICDDGVDNDCDILIDCEDVDSCSIDNSCQAQQPDTSPYLIFIEEATQAVDNYKTGSDRDIFLNSLKTAIHNLFPQQNPQTDEVQDER